MDEDPPVRDCWVRYPPRELDGVLLPEGAIQALRLVVSEEDLPTEEALELRMETTEAEDPVAMVKAILTAHRHRVFPSERTMEWLVQGLTEWANHDGGKSLELCLGLKKPSGQAANLLKERTRERMIEIMLKNMLRLHCAFGIQIKDAAAMVACFMEDTSWNKTGFQFKPLSEDTLLAYWGDAEWVKDPDIREIYTRAYDEDRRRDLLDRFPRRGWEHMAEMKAYL